MSIRKIGQTISIWKLQSNTEKQGGFQQHLITNVSNSCLYTRPPPTHTQTYSSAIHSSRVFYSSWQLYMYRLTSPPTTSRKGIFFGRGCAAPFDKESLNCFLLLLTLERHKWKPSSYFRAELFSKAALESVLNSARASRLCQQEERF